MRRGPYRAYPRAALPSAARRGRSRRGPRTQLLLGLLAERSGAPTDESNQHVREEARHDTRLGLLHARLAWRLLGEARLRETASVGVSATREYRLCKVF
jgi:hypothetical protein